MSQLGNKANEAVATVDAGVDVSSRVQGWSMPWDGIVERHQYSEPIRAAISDAKWSFAHPWPVRHEIVSGLRNALHTEQSSLLEQHKGYLKVEQPVLAGLRLALTARSQSRHEKLAKKHAWAGGLEVLAMVDHRPE